MNSPTSAPVQKVAAGGVGAAVSVVVLYLLAKYAGFSPPPDVTLALGGLIVGAVQFLASYVVPPSTKDAPVPAPPKAVTP
jgi:uncharacterized membrane protein YjjB (DUF3815 family)